MKSLHPCIWLADKLHETTAFYGSLLSDAEVIPMNSFMERVKFGASAIEFMVAGTQCRPNASISMYLVCKTKEQTVAAWKQLCSSSKVLMPLQEYDWGPLYGWVEDRFGVSWQITHGDAGGNPQTVTPSLMFTGAQFGRAKEAIELYTSIFPNSEIQYADIYQNDDLLQAGKVSHAQASLNGNRIIVMDSGMDHGDLKFTEGTSLLVTCDSQLEIDHYWGSLTAEGGAPGQCGWLKDRFGVSWQVIPHQLGNWMSNFERAQRIGPLLQTMSKLDLAALRDA